nr:NAD(+) synthase [Blastochloris viridis]
MAGTDRPGVPPQRPFGPDVLAIDAAAETARIAELVRTQVLRTLRRRGAVVGLSGGIDSSVTAALCVRALGPDKVLGLFMPEKDSEDDSLRLGRMLAEQLGIKAVVEDIAPALEAAGCYRRRDAFIRSVVPEFEAGWSCKVTIADVLGGGYHLSSLVVQSPGGEQRTVRLPLEAYLGIVAATNMKQRTRKQLEYYHADRLGFAVAGTPNRLEHDQGFFVKNGDGAADFKPIAHLFKTQVYQLAEHLGIPEEIRRRPPTTDTWSLPQTQEEFYFSLPYDRMDLCLYALDHAVPADVAAPALGLSVEQIEQVWRDIAAKRRVSVYLHAAPLLAGPAG